MSGFFQRLRHSKNRSFLCFCPIEGSNFTIDVDSVIVAIGTDANPLISGTTEGLNINKYGYIITDEQGRTNKKRVYAGGDIVTGSATVIEAMGAGKNVAQVIDGDLKNLDVK